MQTLISFSISLSWETISWYYQHLPPYLYSLTTIPPLLHTLLFQPALTLEEEDTLLRAFSAVTFHSCIQWEWDSRKLLLEQLWIFLPLLRRIYPEFVPLHTKARFFLICTPDTATLLTQHLLSITVNVIFFCSPPYSQSICGQQCADPLHKYVPSVCANPIIVPTHTHLIMYN